jgi:alkylhydroperoxidase family enzyme
VAKLPYVPAGASPRVDELYARIGGLGRPVLNLYRVLANQPDALAAFLGMSAYVRDRASLDAPLRELLILVTAHELGEGYELAQHLAIARRLGLDAGKIEAATGGAADALDDAERSAVDYAREVARTRTCSEATFAALRSHFSDAETVDVAVTVAWYHLCAAILGPLGVELENA